MRKKEYPILEFDTNKTALINPETIARKRYPERLLITFFKDAMDTLIQEQKITVYDRIEGEGYWIIRLM